MMVRRPYVAIEDRMMASYRAEKLQGLKQYVHLRLGMPTGVTKGMTDWRSERQYKLMTLPEADLAWRTETGAVLAEFSVWYPLQKVGQLLVYRRLLPETPDWEDLTIDKIEARLVLGRTYPLAEAEAKAQGIRVEPYRPTWLREELALRRGRWRVY